MTNLYRYLDSVGDGSGNDNFNGDYSAAAEEGIIAPPSDEVFTINRMIVSIQDASGMSASDYGNIAGGLANGISIGTDDGSNELVDITDGISIKTNSEWGMLCYDVDLKTWSTGPELMLVRFTFSKSGEPVTLYGTNNHRFVVGFNDDLSTLEGHRFMIQGTKRKI